MTVPYTNLDVATNLQPDTMREALMRIATILDGEPREPGIEWSSDEIEYVADQITALGFVIRPPDVEYDPLTLDRKENG